MGLRRISEPQVEPVGVDDAKDHLNFESDLKDDLIGRLISAARAYVENWCHIIVAESEWEITYDAFPDGDIDLPAFPLVSVDEIAYDDADGDEQTLSGESDYTLDLSGDFPRLVAPGGWPASSGLTNSVRIAVTAGYENDSNVSTAPQPIQQAILLLVGHWFGNREGVAPNTLSELPLGVEALISPYKVPVIA